MKKTREGGSITPKQWQSAYSQTGFAHRVASSSVASVLSHSLSRLGQDFLPLYLLWSIIMQWSSNQSDCSYMGSTDTCMLFPGQTATCSHLTSGHLVNDLHVIYVIGALIHQGAD